MASDPRLRGWSLPSCSTLTILRWEGGVPRFVLFSIASHLLVVVESNLIISFQLKFYEFLFWVLQSNQEYDRDHQCSFEFLQMAKWRQSYHHHPIQKHSFHRLVLHNTSFLSLCSHHSSFRDLLQELQSYLLGHGFPFPQQSSFV
jgi:hypothetical protein